MPGVTICSHRGPISFREGPDGLAPERAGPGGLVAVVAPAHERLGGLWLFAPGSEPDRAIAAGGEVVEVGGCSYALVDLPREAHDDAYLTVYTQLLVPLFHYLLPLADRPTFARSLRRAWDGYRTLNECYGAALRRHARGDGVLVEDAHLMLAAAAARAEPGLPDLPLAYFHHMPWCVPEYFAVLPDDIRHDILTGMLAFDSVGFHTERWASDFARCCERFLPGARRSAGAVEWRGRSVNVLTAPAALEVDEVRSRVAAPETGVWRERFRSTLAGRRAVVRIERTDPAKNTIRGLKAYELLLEQRPDLRETTCLLAVLTPVRQWAPAYQDYREATEAEARRINGRFAGSGGGPAPVSLHLAPDPHVFDHHRALAALAEAEVVVANPVYDGLNLVAMEAVLAGDPSVIVSENAGASEYLAPHAAVVNPFDVTGTADELERALETGARERRERAERMRAVVEANTPVGWARTRLEDAARAVAAATDERAPSGR